MIALGILDALIREVGSVGIFRPIVKGKNRDAILSTLLTQPGIEQSYDSAVGVTYDDVSRDPEGCLERLVAKYGELQGQYSTILILGSDYTGVTAPIELTFNARLAANLNAPVVVVVSGAGRTPEDVKSAAEGAITVFVEHHTHPVAVIANRVDPEKLEPTREALASIPGLFTGALPAEPILAAPTLASQVEAVGGTWVHGNEELAHREAADVLVGAMTLPNLLSRLTSHSTVLVPSDRTDMLPGLLLAHTAGSFPQLTGIILVGGYEIPETITRLIQNVRSELPIAATSLGSYTAAERLFRIEGAMTGSSRKVEIARRIFAENIDSKELLAKLELNPSSIVTPLMFQYQLLEMARADKRTIVLPESVDDRILQSAAILNRRGAAKLILLGDPLAVKARATALNVALEGIEVVDPTNPETVERFAAEYARLRAHKGVTIEQAREKMADLSYFGTMMVHLGMADGMVSGAINTTANTIRPSLEFIKTKPGVKVVSGSFLMCMPDRVHVYADCAVNPDPTAEQLADIAISSAETAAAFGIEPRVAMLSYSTGTSGSGADVDKVREATEIVRSRKPDLALEGPIQFDAAVDPEVARTKLPNSPVAGKATVFIFPDLNTGNNTYKAVQRSSGAIAIGPILQGLNKAVNDLSRGALVDDIVNTVVITAIQAQSEPKDPA